MTELPVIDVGPLVRGEPERSDAAAELDAACRRHGFFLIAGHAVDPELQRRLDDLAREFFALDDGEKAAVSMDHGGRAWRGWFPVGDELTSGIPDRKEGYYFGRELGSDDPRVRARVPLHGPNLFPKRPAGLREAVLAYLDAMTALAQTLMAGLALGLGLDDDYFRRELTANPTILFRIFHYPPIAQAEASTEWGVAEHTDYGLLTILRQDDTGGLEVHTPEGWLEAPPIPETFVCNLGDMLERMTNGLYRSTPHRVRPPRGSEAIGRLSFPFFFDPSWNATVEPIPIDRPAAGSEARRRWDDADPLDFDGTYGEYLTTKVAKVFPTLRDDVL